MSIHLTLKLTGAVSLCSLLYAGTAVSAQQNQNADDIMLEEIVVTASKRQQSIQDVPISVTALSVEKLNLSKIDSLDRVSTFSPGFSISIYNPVTPQPYIRGVGTNSNSIADDSSVGVFIDEVYAGRAGAFMASYFDLARVEILRGPQGTLYGRNVSGGRLI